MKLKLVNVEDGITSIGFRKMAAQIKSFHPDTTTCYVTPGRRSLREFLSPSHSNRSEQLCEEVSEGLADADLVAFSSMSIHAKTIQGVIARLREKNPNAFVLWGGCHGVLDSDSAIEHADAVCTGEGELAFPEFFDAWRDGRDYTGTRNFWFRKDGEVVKNPFLPLLTSEQLGSFPAPEYGNEDERIYEPGRGFIPMGREHYLRYNGLSYRTVWSIGCPFHCTFCGNTKFIANDKAYQKIRHSPIPALMRELQGVVDRHPHVRSIVFDDDSFMALRMSLIDEFADLYREKIGVPFTVTGVIPNYVKQEKLERLTKAGLIRIRIGVQSGSERMLEFYKRPAPPEKVLAAATTVNGFRRTMIPPAYDIIADNPIETEEDVRSTLQLIYDMPRPFTLNIFSLNVMPNTDLARQFEELGVKPGDLNTNFKRLTPTLANATLYLLCLVRPPRWVFERLLKRARPFREETRFYPRLNGFLRLLWLARRGFDHLRFMDFANLPGRVGYFLYGIGFIDLWHRTLAPNAGVVRVPAKRPAETS